MLASPVEDLLSPASFASNILIASFKAFASPNWDGESKNRNHYKELTGVDTC